MSNRHGKCKLHKAHFSCPVIGGSYNHVIAKCAHDWKYWTPKTIPGC